MKNVLKKALLINIFALAVLSASAQDKDLNPIPTAMPSLAIAPDARGGGMGDAGVATAPDVYSQHWNPAKYAFSPSKSGFGLSYTPWLRKIVNDVALVYGVGYYKLGKENNQALSASIRYFSIGDIDVIDQYGFFLNKVAPHEMAIDLGYSRKLTETFSGSVAIRYIRSDYSGADEEISAGSAFAADISGYNEFYIGENTDRESLVSLGFNISNIGTKISTTGGDRKDFLPTNLRVGGSIMYPLSQSGTLSVSLDLNKLLVPARPIMNEDETPNEYNNRLENEYFNMSPIKGIFKSFGDAPGGFSEELKEIMWSLGAEYDYADSKRNRFRLRAGYFHENKMKGNRQYVSFGGGFKLTAFQLDVAYMLATAQQNPLDQTLRFSLAFDIDAMKNLWK